MRSSPPSADSGVFSVTASIVINAPCERVWATMLDFASYKDWNPFVRGQTIVDWRRKPLADQTPAEGRYLKIGPVHLPPTMNEPTGWFKKFFAFERITVVDSENYRLAWANVEMPRFLLAAERWQILTIEGNNQVKYESVEVFGGLLAHLVKFLLYEKLELGFKAHAKGLKDWVEQHP